MKGVLNGLLVVAVIVMVIALLDKDPPRPSMNQPHINAVITVLSDSIVLENRNGFDWINLTAYINGTPPYAYHAAVPATPMQGKVTIPLAEFAKDSGERFNPVTFKVTNLWIGGGDYDFVAYGF